MRSVKGWIVLLLLGGRSTRFDGSDGLRMDDSVADSRR